MLAVSNTSPISNLAFIGHLNLLRLQFGTLWIPDAVAGELAVHPDPVALAAVQKAIRDQWIKTVCAATLDAVECFAFVAS
jgi:predicted nucleic acid-binding protein